MVPLWPRTVMPGAEGGGAVAVEVDAVAGPVLPSTMVPLPLSAAVALEAEDAVTVDVDACR
jgi:hypothetical protein